MSAYILSSENFQKIIKTVKENAKLRDSIILENKKYSLMDESDLEFLGQILVDENFKSVNTRYKESEPSFQFKYSKTVKSFSLIEMLKGLDCYIYQSSQTESWINSYAYKIVEKIRSIIIEALPGYAEAEWLS